MAGVRTTAEAPFDSGRRQGVFVGVFGAGGEDDLVVTGIGAEEIGGPEWEYCLGGVTAGESAENQEEATQRGHDPAGQVRQMDARSACFGSRNQRRRTEDPGAQLRRRWAWDPLP